MELPRRTFLHLAAGTAAVSAVPRVASAQAYPSQAAPSSWDRRGACCSAVIPMPLSATASSIQARPAATLRTRSATSPSFVNLQALLKRLSKICLSRMGIRGERAQVLLRFNDEPVLVLLSKLTGGADDLIDQPDQINGLGIEFELASFDFREVQ